MQAGWQRSGTGLHGTTRTVDWGSGGLQGHGEFEDEKDKVREIEISYIDPGTGSLCTRTCFCEPSDWEERHQARLLVSSDLVNSLSEAIGIWLGRFNQVFDRLTHSRMFYFYELGRLRKHMQTVHDGERELEKLEQIKAKRGSLRGADTLDLSAPTSPKDALSGGIKAPSPTKEKHPEVCPIHFFFPETYLDRYTQEMLKKAVQTCRTALELEIAQILERINVVGAGTWWQLLAYFLKNGTDPMELVVGLLHHIEDPAERREIVNIMTNGLPDQYDALLAALEALQAENQDMQNRSAAIRDRALEQDKAMADLRKKMQDAKMELQMPGFEEPPEEDTTEEVAEMQKQMMAQKDASLKAYMAEVRKLRALMEEWQARAAEQCDEEAIKAIEAEIAEWNSRTRKVEMRTQKIDERRFVVDDRIITISDKLKKLNAQLAALREKIAAAGGVTDPLQMKLMLLKRELKALEREGQKIIAAMKRPNLHIKAMRSQLRELYKKLGWEWDLSDSEDEGEEEQPYWKRRKLASKASLIPFDPCEFVFDEKDFQHRRNTRRLKTAQGAQKTHILEQMKAKRHQVGTSTTQRWNSVQECFMQQCATFDGTSKPSQSREMKSRELQLDDEEPGPTMFAASEPTREPVDPVERAISTARTRLALPGTRHALLETPCWRRAQHAEDGESKQNDLHRLLQLRESFESQLQQCVECFVDLLPASGALGDLRLKLVDTMAKFRRLPEENEEADEVETELQETCEALQGMIEEAIAYGEQVHPISAAMMHSVRFSDLRHLLTEVLESERQMREALKAHRDTRGRLPSPPTDSQLMTPADSHRYPATVTSSESSPRLRGQSAPGGSTDDRGLSMASRGLPSAEELSDSLKLPPRLLAQTMPLLGARQPKKDAPKKVDFGFRPDGAGEDSLENWSLFKVSKASTATSGFGESVSTGLGLTQSSGFTGFIGDNMRKTETKVRRQRGAVDCDFHEYMSQSRQMDEAWQTASSPSLLGKAKKKSCPPLPHLVKSASAQRSLTAGGAGTRGGDVFGTWEKKLSLDKVYASGPSKTLATSTKFTATAPPSGMFTKW